MVPVVTPIVPSAAPCRRANGVDWATALLPQESGRGLRLWLVTRGGGKCDLPFTCAASACCDELIQFAHSSCAWSSSSQLSGQSQPGWVGGFAYPSSSRCSGQSWPCRVRGVRGGGGRLSSSAQGFRSRLFAPRSCNIISALYLTAQGLPLFRTLANRYFCCSLAVSFQPPRCFRC